MLGIREALRLPTLGKRALAAALRSATALFACLVAVQPQWVEEEVKQIEGRLAVLLDVSRSMAVRSSVGADGDKDESRLAQAVARLSPLLDKPQAGVDLYAFGNDVRPARFADISGRAQAIDDDTRIGDAVRKVVRDHGDALGAVLVILDGADQEVGFDGRGLKDLGVRVHTVPSAKRAGARRRDPRLQAMVTVLWRARLVEVAVRSSQPAGLGRVVCGTKASWRGGDGRARCRGQRKVSAAVTPMRIGPRVYSVSLPVDAADAVPENNERAFLVRVRATLRVLLVGRLPTGTRAFCARS